MDHHLFDPPCGGGGKSLPPDPRAMTPWSQRTDGSRSRRWRHGLPVHVDAVWSQRPVPHLRHRPAGLCAQGAGAAYGSRPWEINRAHGMHREDRARQRGAAPPVQPQRPLRGSPRRRRARGRARHPAHRRKIPARPWLCSATALLSASSWPCQGIPPEEAHPCHMRTILRDLSGLGRRGVPCAI